MLKSALFRTLIAAAVFATAKSVPRGSRPAKRASCTVNSVATASDLSDCTTVTIEAFTVPSGSEPSCIATLVICVKVHTRLGVLSLKVILSCILLSVGFAFNDLPAC